MAPRQRQASRSRRLPASTSKPAPSRKPDTWSSNARSTSPPRTHAVQEAGAAARTPHHRIRPRRAVGTAYITFPPVHELERVHANNAVAVTPTHPLVLIHQANKPSAPMENTSDGARSTKSDALKRASGNLQQIDRAAGASVCRRKSSIDPTDRRPMTAINDSSNDNPLAPPPNPATPPRHHNSKPNTHRGHSRRERNEAGPTARHDQAHN